jgi:predicted nucleic acid-binding protein
MIAYVDSSVLLRLALGQSNALPEWRQIDRGISSALVSTESLRTLDRARIRAGLLDIEVARRRATILNLIGSLELIEVDSTVLDRARLLFSLRRARSSALIHPPPLRQRGYDTRRLID